MQTRHNMKVLSFAIGLAVSLVAGGSCVGQAAPPSNAPIVSIQASAPNLPTFPSSSGTSNFVTVAASNTSSPSITNSVTAHAGVDRAFENWKMWRPLWSAFWGAFFAALFSLAAGAFISWRKRRHLTRNLKVYSDLPHGNHFRCRVFNGGRWTVRNAAIYITLDCTKDDTCKPPGDVHKAIIRPDHFVPLEEGQLCWSARSPDAMYPTKTDIYAKECQGFSPCAFTDPKDMLIISSEEGWPRFANDPHKARVFLRPKPYTGYLKIVSEDTDAKCYEITIDPANTTSPIQLRIISNKECKMRKEVTSL